jgi:hypothetical protein
MALNNAEPERAYRQRRARARAEKLWRSWWKRLGVELDQDPVLEGIAERDARQIQRRLRAVGRAARRALESGATEAELRAAVLQSVQATDLDEIRLRPQHADSSGHEFR